MQFKSLGPSGTGQQAEYVDLIVKNVSGATITTGYAAAFTTAAGSADGIGVVLPATSNLRSFAGVSLSDLPNNAVGTVRAYGYVNSVFIYAHGTSATIALGEPMAPAAASLGFSSTGLVTAYGPLVATLAAGAAITSPGGYASAHIRNL